VLYNELSEIVPIPQKAWDKTSASSPVGNYDTTAAGAKAVYKFINSQATQERTYASNPLWGVVDGPWKLSAFSTVTGASTFVPKLPGSGNTAAGGELGEHARQWCQLYVCRILVADLACWTLHRRSGRWLQLHR
jgi:hypothetical protein